MGLTLYQHGVDDKTNEIHKCVNEIGAMDAVLSALALEGRVVTVDALLTQKEIAKTITEKGGTT